jgi:GpV Apex motif
MKKGIVVATHPGDHSVDVVLSDGRRLTGVQVLTPNGSARSGTFDMPAVPERRGDRWDIRETNGQDQVALVEFVGEVPVVVGFLFPQVSQMTFDDPKLRVTRHQSDVMSVVDGDGNMQITHPSGAYIRLGETADAVDLSAKNTDASLATDRNAGRKLFLRVVVPGAFDLKITPEGQLTLTLERGAVIDAPDGITLNTPLVSVPNGDVVASGISLVQHVHGGIEPGPSNTGVPVG